MREDCIRGAMLSIQKRYEREACQIPMRYSPSADHVVESISPRHRIVSFIICSARCRMFAFRSVTFLSLLLHFLTIANALHFYLDANEKRCFIEELPSDTVVEGMCSNNYLRGHAS